MTSTAYRLTIAIAILQLSLLAVAEDTTDPADAGAEPIDDIVVTARRREENLQEVPVSITAFSGEQLEARQLYAMDQLGAFVPNLQFDKAAPSSGSSSVGQIFIRGIGQADFTPVTDPGVAMYVDSIYIGRSPGNVLDLVDVERVEVLRGPQGTLFGRNSIGGAIKVHSRLPSFIDTANRIELRLGNDDLRSMILRGNLPLTESLATSIAIGRQQRDGYVERTFDGIRTGDRDRWSARGAVRWEPTDAFAVSLIVDYTTIDENGAPVVSGGVNDRQPFATFGNAVLESCDAVVINPAFDATPQGGPPTFPPPGAPTGSAPGCYGADSRPGPFVSEGTFPVASELDSGTKNRIDPLMLAAQAYQESELEHDRQSSAGAVGIMQIKPSTAADRNVGIKDVSTPGDNIEAGAKYMRFLMDRYYSDSEMEGIQQWLFALASYNAGPAKIQRLRKQAAAEGYNPNVWIDNVELIAARKIGRETVTYVRNVFKYYVAYRLASQNRQLREAVAPQ